MSDLPSSLLEYEAILAAAVDPVKLPSVAYGISRGADTLLLGAVGFADKEAGRLATPRTPYSLASITKPMTATAVMLLAERGLVNVHAPIDDYLGDARLEPKVGDSREATVWRVADHTSGLPLHFQFFYADEPYSRPEMAETIRRYGKLYTIPGQRHQYSNLGYGLLDDLISRKSGSTYKRFMAEEIFAPLGMGHSAIEAPSDAAVPYGLDGVAYPWYDFDHPGGSAAFCSVEDLLRFGQFHLGHGPGILSSDARRRMQERTAVIRGSHGYGFGWGINEDRLGYRLIQHTGSMGGVTTILRLVPELDLAIATLTNGESSLASRSADEAMAALLPDFRDRLTQEAPVPAVPSLPIPPEFSGKWRGHVETYEGRRRLGISVDGPDRATASLDGEERPIEELQIREGRLLGVFDGDIRTSDASRRPHRIHLDLTPAPDRLYGAAVTLTHNPDPGGAKGKRIGNALAYWTELSR